MIKPFTNVDTNRILGDRFIPMRNSLEDSHLYNKITNVKDDQILDSILPCKKRLFSFNKKPQTKIMKELQTNTKSQLQKKYKIPQKPIRVLEAPGLLDDYYLNLVCWGKTNQISVGLDNSVYFYNFLNNKVTKHFDLNDIYSNQYFDNDFEFSPYVCSLSFNDNGRNMAISDSNGQIYLTDVHKNKVISNEVVNSHRIGSLHWQENMLICGSRDKLIRLFDVRQKFCKPLYSFAGHDQEICGLKFSPDNKFIASGGNDNQLLVWDLRRMQLLGELGEHNAAIKALAWNPRKKNILVSGAGTSDRHLRVFDVNTASQLCKVDTGSQVCNVTFDLEGDKLLSTHGYSLNQLVVWSGNKSFTQVQKEEVLIAHKLRVLYLANSPCGKYVVTGAGDETLRIWKVFKDKNKSNQSILNSTITKMR